MAEEIIEKQKQSLINIGKVDDNTAMTQMWGLNAALIQEINKSAMIRTSKHGMFASVPIICQVQDCAYKDTCTVDVTNRVIGQRCPMEIGAIIARFNQYCIHFGLKTDGDTIAEEDLVDATLIKDLVTIEVQQMRCENKIAMSGDFMGKTLLDIDKKCKPYYGDIISPESEHLLVLQDKKVKILNQLNATRKDKANDKSKSASPTENAIKIFQEVQKAIREQTIIDIDTIDFDEQINEYDNQNDNSELNSLIQPEE
jgi:hypothetical protein